MMKKWRVTLARERRRFSDPVGPTITIDVEAETREDAHWAAHEIIRLREPKKRFATLSASRIKS